MITRSCWWWCYVVVILFSLVHSDLPVADEVLKGTYERIDDEKIEMVYQLPTGTVKGVLTVFHGCSHRATDWFPKSESCKKCIGLPVERVIAKKSLDSGLAVLAITSSNKEHKCWSPHSDTMPVARAIKHFYTLLSTKQGPSVANTAGTGAGSSVFVVEKMTPPLFLLGASSGGSFVGNFAAEGKSLNVLVSAICVQISVVRQTNQSSRLPPTLFVHMALDPHTSRGVNRAVEVLNKKTTMNTGGTQENNRAAQLVCEPKALIPTFFFDHGAALSAQDSATLVTAFKEAGIVDATTGKLKSDPRSSMVDWRQV